MDDLLIRGTMIYDGTGAEPVQADLAVRNGRIRAIGPSLRVDASRVIDAAGLALMPGIIDSHTHFDAQVTPAQDGCLGADALHRDARSGGLAFVHHLAVDHDEAAGRVFRPDGAADGHRRHLAALLGTEFSQRHGAGFGGSRGRRLSRTRREGGGQRGGDDGLRLRPHSAGRDSRCRRRCRHHHRR